jgi:hypothetical protein
MQVDFLEKNPDYSMAFTNTIELNEGGRTTVHNRYTTESDAPISDVILHGGGFMGTASICYRTLYLFNRPKETMSQYVGDFPLQIYLTHVGRVRYFSDVTTVYRCNTVGSWTERVLMNKSKEMIEQRLKNEMKLVRDMDSVTGYKYTKIFRRYAKTYAWKCYQQIGDVKKERKLFFEIKHPVKGYNWKAYVYLLLKYMGLKPATKEDKKRS